MGNAISSVSHSVASVVQSVASVPVQAIQAVATPVISGAGSLGGQVAGAALSPIAASAPIVGGAIGGVLGKNGSNAAALGAVAGAALGDPAGLASLGLAYPQSTNAGTPQAATRPTYSVGAVSASPVATSNTTLYLVMGVALVGAFFLLKKKGRK